MSKYDLFASVENFEIPKTMQAVIACGKGFKNLQVAEIPVPQINADQILARVFGIGQHHPPLQRVFDSLCGPVPCRFVVNAVGDLSQTSLRIPEGRYHLLNGCRGKLQNTDGVREVVCVILRRLHCRT